jgi:hypothetical protein
MPTDKQGEEHRMAAGDGNPEHRTALLEDVIDHWNRITNDSSGHVAVVDGVRYEQPYVYLVAHLVETWAAGWEDADFDTVAAVSGASALYGYQPRDFMPKYAHLMVGPDERIAEATGFGYEWVGWEDAEGCWRLLKETIDSGRPAKGWDWENCLFAGYRDADRPEDRKVFMMADGPGTYCEWRTWEQFLEWVGRVSNWNQKSLGRHTTRVAALPEREIAARVVRDLVAWSEQPPPNVSDRFGEATFGLAGIERYATGCADVEAFEDWAACHDINPQWTLRRSTAVYLERVADAGLFPEEAAGHIRDAATHYRDAFADWQEFYALLGHHAPEGAGKMKDRRAAGAAVARRWLEHEKAAIGQLRKALASLGE